MRTTLTLDDDVAAKLQAEARRSGRSFREVVNEAIRSGLVNRRRVTPAEPFRVAVRDLGNVRPGVDLDNIADLIERVERSTHR
jgi:hypothetical protein